MCRFARSPHSPVIAVVHAKRSLIHVEVPSIPQQPAANSTIRADCKVGQGTIEGAKTKPGLWGELKSSAEHVANDYFGDRERQR